MTKANKIAIALFLSAGMMSLVNVYHGHGLISEKKSDPPSSSIPIQLVHDSVCKGPNEPDWNKLCLGGFVKSAAEHLITGQDISFVQIGAHTGFEQNDPLATGMSNMLKQIATVGGTKAGIQKLAHWTFVEPAPPNFKRLAENIASHSDICDMRSINAAVVPDGSGAGDMITFYHMRDTIDPTTGRDSLSKKKLPYTITQISSLDRTYMVNNYGRHFRRQKLNVDDYVIGTNVTAMSFTDVIAAAINTTSQQEQQTNAPLLVMIDTEGFDCEIIMSISPSSPYLPNYLVFEIEHCGEENKEKAFKHLSSMGYNISAQSQNAVATKNKVSTV